MRLWLIRRTDWTDWDEHDSAVIRAESEADARRIASEKLRPRGVWLADITTCAPLVDDGEPGIVVESFNAS